MTKKAASLNQNCKMKKLITLLPYVIILCLLATIGFLTFSKQETKTINQTINTKSKTYVNLPVASIDIEPLINQYCIATTANKRATWGYFGQRRPVPNTNNNDYICYIDNKVAKVATTDLFTNKSDSSIVAYSPGSICNKIFNPEFFRGVATDDQSACTLIAK